MDDQGSIAVLIRQFLRDLFGSRLVSHLTEELMRLRQDYETRLLERDRALADLREELVQARAKIDRYELVLIPLIHPSARPQRPATLQAMTEEPRPLTWSEIQLEHDREQSRLAMEEAKAAKAQVAQPAPQ